MWEVLKLAVAGAVRPPRQLPPVLFYNELAAVPGDAWLGFQAALVAQDRRAAAWAGMQPVTSIHADTNGDSNGAGAATRWLYWTGALLYN